MIRKANDQDKAALRDIWCAVFDDTLDYAAFVTDHCLKLGTVLYYPEGLSFLTLFPLTLHFKGKNILQGAYLYGVATHPRRQRKGFGSMLLARASEIAPFLLLYPATHDLQHFYHKRGFDVPVHIPSPVVRTNLPDRPSPHHPAAAPYTEYIADAGKQDYTFLWSPSLYDYAYRECLFRGGYVMSPWFCYPQDGNVVCKPYMNTGLTTNASYLRALVRFNITVPGFRSENALFYLPLD
ncbi:MAG: GNAT family N-acetyltransferase [Bacteroidales bacterium]|nr:GNAT family N-acetyltransferase [Bacteroidales bacterium]MDD2263408.1 GNAT family N-acetyltransferase [Bacteroidales bacterium]MDD2830802.1 GNAT family N-acetyltransferase [Bacteroidales bacterium]MDD3208001.1 GNAT family N-acetyltransferase [Bacteroidales bacterium]MDD3696492.1 GNAT family N-acetyltransferase [Bacteroidales bacterium]